MKKEIIAEYKYEIPLDDIDEEALKELEEEGIAIQELVDYIRKKMYDLFCESIKNETETKD